MSNIRYNCIYRLEKDLRAKWAAEKDIQKVCSVLRDRYLNNYSPFEGENGLGKLEEQIVEPA
jgi:hypothetical protein